VFSFASARIGAYGIARSYAYEAPQPVEFGAAGRNWDDIGWRVDVQFIELSSPVRPADWIGHLRPLLPERYAPLQPDGHGVQSIYLTELSRALALALADLVSAEVAALARLEVSREVPESTPNPELEGWEEHLRRRIENDTAVPETERIQLVLARRGQGRFREQVQVHEVQCRITGVNRPEHLRASHIKPWRDSTNAERLSGENGLLLTPSIDHLFDRGFLSFAESGRLLISPVAHQGSLIKMGVPVDRDFNAGGFTRIQNEFLDYHRDAVFLSSKVNRAG
jgi:hypothetical protein